MKYLAVSQEKLSWIFHGVIPVLFMCCVSENGRCHVWPQPIEFSSAALSCSMLSRLSVFPQTGRLVQPSFQGSCLFSVAGQETCALSTCNKMLVHSPKERKEKTCLVIAAVYREWAVFPTLLYAVGLSNVWRCLVLFFAGLEMKWF